VKARNGKQNENRPGINLSDWPTQHNRSGPLGSEFYRISAPMMTLSPAASRLLFLTILCSYLGAKASRRNEAAVTVSTGIGTLVMTTFDKREEGFEKKFALDEELKFKAEARRNKLLGLWVASMLGMSGDEANAYAKEVVAAEFAGAGAADVVRKVIDDLSAKGISITETQIRAKMDELMAQAVAQVKAGT